MGRDGGWNGRASGQLFLQPGDPGGQPGKGIVQTLIAEADQAQLRVGAAVGAPGQIREGVLEELQHLEEPGGGELFPQSPHGRLVIAAGEQGGPALGRGLAEQQVPGQGG